MAPPLRVPALLARTRSFQQEEVVMSLKVDVWSDVSCPWCYIGATRLQAGAQAAGVDIEVEYHSYQLAPQNPVDVDGSYYAYFAGRLGVSQTQARSMMASVTAVAEGVGLHYDFDAVQPTNTLSAHELLHYAKAHGVQREMKERLFAAYFTEGRHVGHIEALADLAEDVGLDRDDVLRSLTEREHLEAVRADITAARDLGVTGVPFFVIDGTYALSGAQEPAAFAAALAKAAGNVQETA